MRKTAIGVTCLVLGSFTSGCCCCCHTVHSPVAYSDGNPYESSGDLWGIGYYCQEFGFLRRADMCGRDIPYRAPATYSAYAPPSTPVQPAPAPAAPAAYDSNPTPAPESSPDSSD